MDQPINGRVVVVTGAGGGFGRLISQMCAALGAKVVCADAPSPSVRNAGQYGNL